MLPEDFNIFIEKEQFYHSYQPLYSLCDKEVVGNEILLRADIGAPDVIFNQAKIVNKLYELDIKSIHKAIYTCLSADCTLKNDLLFLNIFPTTLVDPQFPAFVDNILAEFPISINHIVFELIEAEKADAQLFIERVQMLKEYGFLIAIDDVGKGWSTLSRIIELEPDFIKLDNYFSQSLSICKKKQSMIKAISNYCDSNDIQLILEGIETEESLTIARSLGIHYGQGYFLCRPQMLKIVE